MDRKHVLLVFARFLQNESQESQNRQLVRHLMRLRDEVRSVTAARSRATMTTRGLRPRPRRAQLLADGSRRLQLSATAPNKDGGETLNTGLKNSSGTRSSRTRCAGPRSTIGSLDGRDAAP